MCVACPHLGVYYTLAQLRNITISGDIGCYTLGYAPPLSTADALLCMGAGFSLAAQVTRHARAKLDASGMEWPRCVASHRA